MKKRIVFITGASRGIGKTIAALLKKKGYKIIAPTRSELDLSDNQSVAKYLNDHKHLPVDIIINNAGINVPQWIDEMDDNNIEDTITALAFVISFTCHNYCIGSIFPTYII